MSVNSLDEIFANIAMYLNPEILKKEFLCKLDFKSINKNQMEKYQELLLSVKHVYKKVQKYEFYFEKFYLPNQINETEVLEYHIHSYLEDLTILKNKIVVFFSTLKNDLKRIVANASDISNVLKKFLKNIEAVFTQVDSFRGPHHHKGLKFMDGKLLEAQNAQSTFEMIESGLLFGLVDPEFVEKVKRKRDQSFEIAKKKWIKIAKENNINIGKFIDDVFSITKGLIYQFFGIKPMNEVFAKM